MRERVRVTEIFGLRPFGQALGGVRRVLAGSPHVPPTRWDVTSARIFKPSISIPTWMGKTRDDRLVPIYNYFNRVPQPKDEGYSVRVTYCRDFRGGQWTYDGHLGTDFACPVGTPIVSAAPGVVLRVASELDRGGLKVCVDHGEGLFTTHNHLSRSLVEPNERIERGQVVGLSGASGVEFILMFPWVAPHLHYNVWLNGEPVDPFAIEGEVSLWKRRNEPTPSDGANGERLAPSPWDAEGVGAAIDACLDPDARESIRALPSLERRAAEVLVLRNYKPTLFSAFPPLYRERFDRAPRLDLPFRASDFRGAWQP